MVGVVVVMWLVVAQQQPNTCHQVLPKTKLVLAFPHMESPTERRERVVVGE